MQFIAEFDKYCTRITVIFSIPYKEQVPNASFNVYLLIMSVVKLR